jgi:hypothetical protein
MLGSLDPGQVAMSTIPWWKQGLDSPGGNNDPGHRSTPRENTLQESKLGDVHVFFLKSTEIHLQIQIGKQVIIRASLNGKILKTHE